MLPGNGRAPDMAPPPDAEVLSLPHPPAGRHVTLVASRWWTVPWPVWLTAGLMLAGLLSLSGAYGFHGDELYFVVAGRHPAFGYVDQPPLTPLLSAAWVALLGVSPTAMRILPALEMAFVVVIVGFIARDLGGSRRAQVLAALTAGVSGYLAAGHLNTTTELDLLVWAAVLWLLVRVLAGGDRRLWVAAGVGAGIGLENKDTLLFLAAGLAAGVLLCRRWEVVRSRWAWAAPAIAAIGWAPNLAWQAVHGWPQLTMASQIAGYSATNRAQVLPFLWLFTGPLLFPVSIAGLVWVLGSRAAALWRPLGVAALVALALDLVSGGKTYYVIGSASLFMAAGGIVLDGWIARGHRLLKTAGFAAAAITSGGLIALLTLPVLPVADYARTALPATVPDVANQIGWPQFVATVAQVVSALPPEQRDHAVILTNDYSEASALVLLGEGLPPVYSGHNSYWSWGPPPAARTTVVHVGDWRPTNWAQYFAGCRDVAHIDNQLGIDNGEQGRPVTVCTSTRAPWTTIWPTLRTIS
ncbi:glycosyltransferase family 39 protein [Microbispora sp. ATCC PTA-5024]|uniref:glycosyltransferase family 39 protein n=1 Tax=Microbispora sp. ATCC PTA-5024 TaxID=316330 RepID=UPI0006EBE08F|nr:glycosyltransferase family 39 protein [Microbispora sp. ATCC PTA-5024]